MKFKCQMLTDGELAVVHGGMQPSPIQTQIGKGVVKQVATDAIVRGHDANARAVANSKPYQRVIGFGALAVFSPQTAGRIAANKLVTVIQGNGKK